MSLAMAGSAPSSRRESISKDNFPEAFKCVVTVVQHCNTTKVEDKSLYIALLIQPAYLYATTIFSLGKVPRWILFESDSRKSQMSPHILQHLRSTQFDGKGQVVISTQIGG